MKDTFHQDNAWQKAVRDRILVPQFYSRYSVQGRFVLIDKGRLATMLQRESAVDTIMQRRDSAIFIEEKIVRWKGFTHLCFALETHSCTVVGRERVGWMQYGEADYLLYCYMQKDDTTLVCYLIDFPQLHSWFWSNLEQFETFGPLPTINRTAGRKVPIVAVCKAVTTKRYVLTDPKAASAPTRYRTQANFNDLLEGDSARYRMPKQTAK